MEAARRLAEYGRPNISQRLNLAHMYVLLGQSRKAQDEVAGIDSGPPSLSSYGMIVLQGVYLRAALQTGDRATSDRVLNYLRQHQADAPAVVIGGLRRSGATGDADALMRTTLGRSKTAGDPAFRSAVIRRYAPNAAGKTASRGDGSSGPIDRKCTPRSPGGAIWTSIQSRNHERRSGRRATASVSISWRVRSLRLNRDGDSRGRHG